MPYDIRRITGSLAPGAPDRFPVTYNRKGLPAYDRTTILLGGKPLPPLTFSAPEPSPAEMRCRCVATVPTEFFAEMARLIPARPEGVVTLSMPWGILGTIKVPAVVQGVTHKGGAAVPSTTTMEGTLDDRALRREIANAVRRAVVGDYAAGSVALRACFEGETATVRKMGHKIAAGPGCAYRGKRKRQRAMRRLLRAAGITRPAP